MTYIVALTGGIASGKSTISSLFEKKNVPIIDADLVAREAVKSKTDAFNQIVQRFGQTILLKNGELDRKKLRKYVFDDPKELNWLNNLLHPIIQKLMLEKISQINAPYIIWVVPLLIENQLDKYANRILVLNIDEKTQFERLMKRDFIDKNLAKKMLSSQISQKERLAHADDIINSNIDFNALEQVVDKLHKKYLNLAKMDQA